MRVGISFWSGKIVDGPLEWRNIKHYQVECSSFSEKGWFPEDCLTALDGFDSPINLSDFFDSDSDTGGGGRGDKGNHPPNNSRSFTLKNNGTNAGSSNTGSAHPPNKIGASSRSGNGGGQNTNNYNVSKMFSPKDLKSEESDQSEGNVVSDEEDSSVDDPEDECSELLGFYARLIMLQLLQEISSRWSAIGLRESAPAESICAQDDCVATEASSPFDAVSGLKDNNVDTAPKLQVCVLGNIYGWYRELQQV